MKRSIVIISMLLSFQLATLCQNTIKKSAYDDKLPVPKPDEEVLPCMAKNGNGITVEISSKKDFGSMRSIIDRLVKQGNKDITLDLASGEYSFNEYCLTLKGLDYKDIDLRISGHGARLSGKGEKYGPESSDCKFDRHSCYLAGDGHEFDVWSPMGQSDRKIEIIDKGAGTCRLHFPGKIADKSNEECRNSFILITMSFQSSVYRIDGIRGGYIYFTADNLEKLENDFNVNHDYIVAKRYPRFKLCNIADMKGELLFSDGRFILPDGTGTVQACSSCCFLHVSDCQLKSLTVEGIAFKGNREASQLITFEKVRASEGITIRDCSFNNIHSDVISIKDTDDVTIYDNEFRDISRGCITSDNKSADTHVIGNSFEICGTDLKNRSCVKCSGTDYLVKDNIFHNFGYCAVSIGLHYTSKQYERICGVVEGNVISCDGKYIADSFSNSLMDSGAVYLSTNNDESIVRYNSIYDCGGYYSNNGIYCDDGAKGFRIYGNVVTGIRNGYTIYSRRVGYIENLPECHVRKTNVDNIMMYNILDGKYMFCGRPGKNGCIKGYNFLIPSKGGKSPETVFKDLEFFEDDMVMKGWTIKSGAVCMEDRMKDFFMTDTVLKGMERFIIK